MTDSISDRLAFDGFAAVASEVAGEVREERIYLPGLDFTISVEATDARMDTNILTVEVTAERGDLHDAIRFTAVGFGDDLREASVAAAEQWFAVVFPVIHGLYADHETANVTRGTMSARHIPTGDRFHWNITSGPVRVVYAGAAEPPPADDGKLLRALSREVSGIAIGTEPFWIDAYVAMQYDGTAIGDCRLLNEEWPEASDRLRMVADDLCNAPDDGFVSWRQFMFFSPAAQPPKKKWWQFW